MTLAVPINLMLNYVLVFGALGVPAMGVAGAGLATSIVCWLMFVGLAAYIARNPVFRAYKLGHGFATLDLAEWRRRGVKCITSELSVKI